MKQLKRHEKPMFLLNIDNFFAPFMALLQHGIAQKTIKADNLDLFKVADTPEQLLKQITNHQALLTCH